jgi:hypothetical protein
MDKPKKSERLIIWTEGVEILDSHNPKPIQTGPLLRSEEDVNRVD